MPLMQKNHVQQKLSKKNSLLFLYKKTYSSSESKAFFKSSILSTFSIIDTTLYKNNNILNESTKSLSDNSYIWYLASRAAVRASDFYGSYKKAVNDKVAPIAS